jgi:hypothetical protein
MDMLDLFRLRADSSLLWIGSASSVSVAKEMAKQIAGNPPETFLIHDHRTNETLTIRFSDSLKTVGNPANQVISNGADTCECQSGKLNRLEK